jgi:hypothetical protein
VGGGGWNGLQRATPPPGGLCCAVRTYPRPATPSTRAAPAPAAQDGASPGVHYFTEMLVRQPGNDAFLVPIPQVCVCVCCARLSGAAPACCAGAGSTRAHGRGLLKGASHNTSERKPPHATQCAAPASPPPPTTTTTHTHTHTHPPHAATQYPLYSATLCLYGGTLVPYELDEDAGGRGAGLLAAARARCVLVLARAPCTCPPSPMPCRPYQHAAAAHHAAHQAGA